MSMQVFLKLPDVEGESLKEGHVGEIEIVSCSLGISNPGTFHQGQGGAHGSSMAGDVSVAALLGKESGKMLQACATGKHFPQAIISCQKTTGDDAAKDFLVITLKPCLISSWSTGLTNGATPMISFALNYGSITYDYKIQGEKGVLTSVGPVGFDWMAMKKAA